MMPQNWTGGDNWSLSSIHSSFWWPLLTSSPGRWSVKVTAEPSSVPVHKPLRLQTVVAVPSASHRDWGHTAINFPASLSLGHQTLQSHRGSKHLPTWNTCSKSDERSRVWRLLLSAFSNAAKFFISPLRDVLGEQVVTCDRGPNVNRRWSSQRQMALPLPWIRVTFIFRDTKSKAVDSLGMPAWGHSCDLCPLLRGAAWHFHACSVFLSISRGRPRRTVHEKCLHFRCPAKSEAARRMEGRGPGPGRLSWFQGAGPGGCAPFPMSIFRNRKHHVSSSRDPHPSSTRWPVSRCPRSGESRGATLLPKLLP